MQDILDYASYNKLAVSYTGDVNFVPLVDDNNTDWHASAFVDSWKYFNNIRGTETSASSSGSDSESVVYTFPACSPIKRIDYILVRNHTTDNVDFSKSSVVTDIEGNILVDKTARTTTRTSSSEYAPRATIRIRNVQIVGTEPTDATS